MIYINSKPIKIINWDLTILQISEEVGISIPRFCYHQTLSIAGNCRMCMVEVETVVKPIIACATSINEDMIIFTNSDLVKTARENVLELLLINHPLDCPIRDQGGECDLQDESLVFGTDRGRFIDIKRSVEDKELGPIVKTIMTRCIHCTRRIRFTREIAGIPVLGTMGRGGDTEISTYVDTFFDSEIIGNIVDLRPVGALTSKPYAFRARSWELQSTEAFDIFDAMMSNIRIDIKDNEILRVLPRRNDYVNSEFITDKVRFFYEGAKINRLLFPLIKKINNENNNIIIHTSNDFAFDYFLSLYNNAKSLKNKSMISIMQDNIDLYDSIYYLKCMDLLEINTYRYNKYEKHLSSDIKYNWLLNHSVTDFVEETNIFILCNVNLKYENPILNALLFNYIYQLDEEEITIYYIGCFYNNTYEVNHIGLTSYVLYLIQNGKHYLTYILQNNCFLFVDSHVNSLFSHDVSGYIKSFENYLNFDIKKCSPRNYAYVPSSSGVLNNLEVGIPFDNIMDKDYSLVYFVGNNNNINLPSADYIIYSGHHLPNALYFDLYLPTTTFYEVAKKNNTSYWLDFTYNMNRYSDRIITPPGETIDNIFMYNILSTMYKSDFEFNIYKLNKFNLYFDNKHNDTDINFNYDLETINTISKLNHWDSYMFYFSDEYSINSYVLREAYYNSKNELDIVNNI